VSGKKPNQEGKGNAITIFFDLEKVINGGGYSKTPTVEGAEQKNCGENERELSMRACS